jgi:hypothetical protein
VSVLRALIKRFRFDSSRIFLNRFKSFWFTLPPPRVAAARDDDVATISTHRHPAGKKEAEV